MHPNSLLAYKDLDLSTRKRRILRCLHALGKPSTDRQVKDAGYYQDMNDVRPRITELIDEDILEMRDDVKDHVSGRTVRTVWFKYKLDESQGQQEIKWGRGYDEISIH